MSVVGAASGRGAGPAVRRALARLSLDRKTRRRLLLIAAAAAVLASGYLLWLRDSPLVRVRSVSVAGLTTDDAPRLRQALTAAARTMTTLHVRRDRLERAVAGYPVVRALEVDAGFPHTLRIRVIEQHPAALAVAGGSRVLVAGDGSVLRGIHVQGSLPVLSVPGRLPPDRLQGPATLRLLRVLAGAPGALVARLRDVRQAGPRGIVVRVRGGPDLVFGDSRRVRAKWTSAARVLADPSARGATYVDVRLPERPAAGGLPTETLAPVAPAGEPRSHVAAPGSPPSSTGAAPTAVPQP